MGPTAPRGGARAGASALGPTPGCPTSAQITDAVSPWPSYGADVSGLGWWRTTAGIAMVAGLVAAGCASDQGAGEDAAGSTTTAVATAPATAPPLPFDPVPIHWRHCAADHDCARVRVPLDWSDPDGATTSVALVRVPATRPDRRIGSLLVNPGGPGGSGIESVLAGGYPPGAGRRFDIVGWDPRGVGESSPLHCGDTVAAWLRADPSPDDATERRDLDRRARAIADECQAEDGDALPFLGTQSEARDLEAIRLALGEEGLTYLGYSAGTMIGARYAALFPTHIRAMVLDGVVDPTTDHEESYLAQARAYEDGLDAIFAHCAADPECPVDDADAAFAEVAAAVERADLPGDPVPLGPAEFGRASFFATYSDELWDTYLRGLAAALAGDGDPLAELAGLYDGSSDYVAYLSIWCVDMPHPEGAREWDAFVDRVVAAAPRIGAVEANELRGCAFWPAPTTRPLDPVVAPGSPPILVVGNTGDAVTPYAEAEAVASALEDGHLLTVDADQHTSGGIPCADAAVAAYLVTVEPPSDDC